MEFQDFEGIENQVYLLCKMLRNTNVVEISNAIETPLNNTIKIVEKLEIRELVSLDSFGNVKYISKKSVPFVITSKTYSRYESSILSFTKTFTPDKFPQQRQLVNNFIRGIEKELELIDEIMDNENNMILRWEPEGPVKDIELSYNHGDKVLHIQVKSGENDISISKTELDKLVNQYGKKGYVAIKIDALPYYLVNAEEMHKNNTFKVDPDTLLRTLPKHYDVELFKQGIKNCTIP